MLEVVGIDFSLICSQVWLYIVIVGNDFDFHALLLGSLFGSCLSLLLTLRLSFRLLSSTRYQPESQSKGCHKHSNFLFHKTPLSLPLGRILSFP